MKFHRHVRVIACKIAAAAYMSLAIFASNGLVCAIAEETAKPAVATKKLSPPPAVNQEEIARSISELGHDAFTVRQAAASRLLAAGTPARDALVALVDGPDPETRAAARRLISQIDQSEFHRRLEAFAADTDGALGVTLPGWDRFKKVVGSDPPARALFVDMQRQGRINRLRIWRHEASEWRVVGFAIVAGNSMAKLDQRPQCRATVGQLRRDVVSRFSTGYRCL